MPSQVLFPSSNKTEDVIIMRKLKAVLFIAPVLHFILEVRENIFYFYFYMTNFISN